MKNIRKQLITLYVAFIVLCAGAMAIFYPTAYELMNMKYNTYLLMVLVLIVLPILYFSIASVFTLFTGLKFTMLQERINKIVLLISVVIVAVYFILVAGWLFGIDFFEKILLQVITIVTDFKYIFLVLGITFNASLPIKDSVNNINIVDEGKEDSEPVAGIVETIDEIQPIESIDEKNIQE